MPTVKNVGSSREGESPAEFRSNNSMHSVRSHGTPTLRGKTRAELSEGGSSVTPNEAVNTSSMSGAERPCEEAALAQNATGAHTPSPGDGSQNPEAIAEIVSRAVAQSIAAVLANVKSTTQQPPTQIKDALSAISAQTATNASPVPQGKGSSKKSGAKAGEKGDSAVGRSKRVSNKKKDEGVENDDVELMEDSPLFGSVIKKSAARLREKRRIALDVDEEDDDEIESLCTSEQSEEDSFEDDDDDDSISEREASPSKRTQKCVRPHKMLASVGEYAFDPQTWHRHVKTTDDAEGIIRFLRDRFDLSHDKKKSVIAQFIETIIEMVGHSLLMAVEKNLLKNRRLVTSLFRGISLLKIHDLRHKRLNVSGLYEALTEVDDEDYVKKALKVLARKKKLSKDSLKTSKKNARREVGSQRTKSRRYEPKNGRFRRK